MADTSLTQAQTSAPAFPQAVQQAARTAARRFEDVLTPFLLRLITMRNTLAAFRMAASNGNRMQGVDLWELFEALWQLLPDFEEMDDNADKASLAIEADLLILMQGMVTPQLLIDAMRAVSGEDVGQEMLQGISNHLIDAIKRDAEYGKAAIVFYAALRRQGYEITSTLNPELASLVFERKTGTRAKKAPAGGGAQGAAPHLLKPAKLARKAARA